LKNFLVSPALRKNKKVAKVPWRCGGTILLLTCHDEATLEMQGAGRASGPRDKLWTTDPARFFTRQAMDSLSCQVLHQAKYNSAAKDAEVLLLM